MKRCSRCGHRPEETDKFCVECGMFLRDSHVDERVMLALAHEREGRHQEARWELRRLLEFEPNNVLVSYAFAVSPVKKYFSGRIPRGV